jgi:hypothetical protein
VSRPARCKAPDLDLTVVAARESTPELGMFDALRSLVDAQAEGACAGAFDDGGRLGLSAHSLRLKNAGLFC